MDGVRKGPLGMCGRSGIARASARMRSGSPLRSMVQNLSGSSSGANERVKGPDSTPGGVQNGGREGDDRDFCPARATESAADALRFIK